MPNFNFTSRQNENDILAGLPRWEKKVITDASVLTTGASPYTLFNVDGDVVARVFGTVQTLLVSTSNNGTLAVGVTGNTGSFLAATTVDGTNFPTGSVWAGDTSPTVKSEVFSACALNWAPIAGGADIIATIATNSLTAGALTLYCQYIPLSTSARVVAA
jgi:hypothetical protein